MLLSAILVALIAILSNWWVSHLLTRSWLYPIISGFLVALALGSPIEGMKPRPTLTLPTSGG